MEADAAADAANEQAADAMILELEALMADVDNAQRALDAKKQQNPLKETVDIDAAMPTDETGAGECGASGEDLGALSPDDDAALTSDGEAKPDAEAIFRELEGLTSMMDSVTQSLISARDGGSHDVGGGGEEAASSHFDGRSVFHEQQSLTPESSLSAFMDAFKKIAGESSAVDVELNAAANAAHQSEVSDRTSISPATISEARDSSTAAFLQAFGDATGGSPLEVPQPASLDNTKTSTRSLHSSSVTTPPPQPPPISATIADPANASFLCALEEVAGGTPWMMPLASAVEKDSTATTSSKLPPPDQVADELLSRLNETVQLNGENGLVDMDSLPLTTSFMSSSGALPPGATPVDFSPLFGSAAASLSVSQMSNEGLASSVEGLNISQVSNEGMATSAIIDTGELTVATSPVWENSNVVENDEDQSKSEAASEATVATDPVVAAAAPLDTPATPSPSNASHSAATPAATPTTSKPSTKKKSPSPLSTSSSSSTSKATAPAPVSAGKSKKSKKSSSPALTPSLNGDLLEPAAVPKETPDNVLKNLHSFSTVEAKLEELTTRHAAAVTLNRELDSQVKLEQRRTLAALKEKEMVNAEHQKALLAKSKLESLCRELQKHSKMIKDEAMKRAQIEESKRKEVADSFQSTIDEVTSRMQNNSERNNALRDQNEELASKMKHLVEQYEQREEHIDKILKHKDLELQLVQAKLDKAEAEKKELSERSTKEREVLLAQTLESVKKNQMLEQNEKHLRAQIELYTEKYDEFQSTLSKSNTVFNNFKSEMAQMTKKIKKLEKEIQMWKGRWESSNSQLEKVTKEKENGEADLKEARSKANKLEKLCRALQQERHSLSSQVTQMKLGKDADGNDLTTATSSSDATVANDLVDNVVDAAD